MEIDSPVHAGKTNCFCSEACHQRSVAAPEQYAA
jgi:YHS domain-containing protein